MITLPEIILFWLTDFLISSIQTLNTQTVKSIQKIYSVPHISTVWFYVNIKKNKKIKAIKLLVRKIVKRKRS